MPVVQSEVEVRSDLVQGLANARAMTDALFDIVKPDSLYDRPIPERHRIIFYIGHLEAFDWNLLRERLFGMATFHPEYDQLFAFGIDPVDGGLPKDQPSDWPSIDAVKQYVAGVRKRIDAGLQELLANDPGLSERKREFPACQLLNVAIEHRLMHAETLAYMLHQQPLHKKVGPPKTPDQRSHSTESDMVTIPAGWATLGLSRDSGEFGWDNEFEAHAVEVPQFSIDRNMVTNGDFLKFMHAGGYENRAWWTDTDWEWKSEHGVRHPAFWSSIGEGWRYITMFEDVELPLDWPVYVSCAEARAYARWAGKSLPTEAQWHRAAYADRDGGERQYPWGAESPSARRGNFDFQRWDPTPVGAFPDGRSALGLNDMLGNGWEWTSTVFAPFEGFERFSFYPGYSADFFDDKHCVIKGGSARTAGCMLRRSFRNWFQAHYQYVYAGFRCVSNS